MKGQRKSSIDGKVVVLLHGLPHYVIQAGPEQSLLWSVQDHEGLPREQCVPNSWCKPYRERMKSERVKLKRKFTPGRTLTEKQMRPTLIECREDEL